MSTPTGDRFEEYHTMDLAGRAKESIYSRACFFSFLIRRF
jgi:hypothetical protein